MNKDSGKNQIVYATAVALPDALSDGASGYTGVLIRGTSGAGKSDLAFRLIESYGARLVSDDQVALSRHQDKIFADTIAPIAGLLEVRGIGLLKYPVQAPVRLQVVIDLCPREALPRLPPPDDRIDIMGIALRRFFIHAPDASAPARVRRALAVVLSPELVLE